MWRPSWYVRTDMFLILNFTSKCTSSSFLSFLLCNKKIKREPWVGTIEDRVTSPDVTSHYCKQIRAFGVVVKRTKNGRARGVGVCSRMGVSIGGQKIRRQLLQDCLWHVTLGFMLIVGRTISVQLFGNRLINIRSCRYVNKMRRAVSIGRKHS